MRKDPLVIGQSYHIFTKSIADFVVFNTIPEFSRMIKVIRYYQNAEPPVKFSEFIESSAVQQEKIVKRILSPGNKRLVEIVAYCLMPTHPHLILKQLKGDGISIFMSNVLNSYTRYFNIKHRRKGPLWEGRFKSVLIKNDEQLLHLTRYIHLNPVTAYLVDKPEDWQASSYLEYISKIDKSKAICKYDKVLQIDPVSYKKFVEDRVVYQRELAKIKELLFR